MVKCSVVCLVVSAIMVCGVGYFLYYPVPDYVDQPWALQKFFAQVKIGAIIAEVSYRVGMGERLDLIREWTYKWGLVSFRLPNYLDNVTITDTTFDGVPVRIYRPSSAPTDKLLPALVYYHGGGWIFLDVETYDSAMAEVCRKSNIVVVSVEYRLAPEHTFPKGFEDCVKATKHVLVNGASHGINTRQVAVGGDSAGGHMTASVTINLRDSKFQPQIKSQVLIYPTLQMCSHSLPMSKEKQESHPDEFLQYMGMIAMWLNLNTNQKSLLIKGKYLTPELNQKCKRLVNAGTIPVEMVPKGYVQDDHVAEDIDDDVKSMSRLMEDPRVSPLLVEDLSKLPPAYVFTVQFDFIRDHGIIYAKRLEKAGNKVVWNHGSDSFHGVFTIFEKENGFKIGPPMMTNITNFLEKSLSG